MICFEGKVSKEVRSFIRKKAIRLNSPISIIFILVGAILFIVNPQFDSYTFIFAFSFILVGIFWLLLPIFCLADLGIEPNKIEIEDGFIECFFVGGRPQMKAGDKVKRVTDRGNFYEIEFYFPPKMVTCICQKDLLVSGTIEEFEKLFEDKIQRKIKMK